MVQEGSSNWLLTDRLGTPRMIADKMGALATAKRHDYLPLGEELLADRISRGQRAMRQKFTDKERDSETGLDYFDARYYAKMQARFTFMRFNTVEY